MSMNKSKVAEIRKQKSLTQENLAEKAYVTVRTIQRMEAGEEVSSETLKSVSIINVYYKHMTLTTISYL